jgi:hypothetical protein
MWPIRELTTRRNELEDEHEMLIKPDRIPTARTLLLVLAAWLTCGCTSPSPQPPIKDAARQGRPSIEVIQRASEGLRKYAPKPKAHLPVLRIPSERSKTEEVATPKEIQLKVRLLGSIQARGGTAADWVGFEPGERLLRAVWTPPKLKGATETPKPIELRVKAKDSKKATEWLGRRVTLTGYWISAPSTESTSTGQVLPSPVELGRRKGQDLLNAVQEIRSQKLDGLGQDKTAEASPKVQGVMPGARGAARASSGRSNRPVFFATETTLTR